MKARSLFLLYIGGTLVLLIGVVVASQGEPLPITNQHNAQPVRTSETNSTGSEELAPDFSLPLHSGGTIQLADFRGEKPVILDFWASWCHNCQRAMPNLSRLYDEYKDDERTFCS